jgi:hypothetical protein
MRLFSYCIIVGSILAATVIAGQARAANEAGSFDDYFTTGVLRIDVIHSGTRGSESIVVRRIVREPVWGGPLVGLVDTTGMGEYHLHVRDKETTATVYERGFSSLFREWTTTGEAEVVERAFEETYELPFPRRVVDIDLSERTETGAMRPLFHVTIDPASVSVERPGSFGNATVRDLAIRGDPHEKVDLAILGDGYTAAEQEKFERDCQHIMGEFFDVEPLKSYRDDFNIRGVFVPSLESGVDEPRKGVVKNTPFGMSFNTFGSERYCMTEEVWAVHDAVSNVPHDAILLMANSSRYGGGAIFNFYTAFVSDNEYDDYLCVHEFGHGFAGLGDEYFDSQVSYNEFYPRGVEPWEPNITALLDPSHVKWGDLADPTTPIPTPADDPRYKNEVGAFEGAGYAAKGLYRPAVDCKMFSKGNCEFCPVCARAFVDAIRRYASE